MPKYKMTPKDKEFAKVLNTRLYQYENLIKNPKNCVKFPSCCGMCCVSVEQYCADCPIDPGKDRLCGTITRATLLEEIERYKYCTQREKLGVLPRIQKIAKRRYQELLKAMKKNGWIYS